MKTRVGLEHCSKPHTLFAGHVRHPQVSVDYGRYQEAQCQHGAVRVIGEKEEGKLAEETRARRGS